MAHRNNLRSEPEELAVGEAPKPRSGRRSHLRQQLGIHGIFHGIYWEMPGLVN